MHPDKSELQKAKYSFYSAIVFLIVSSPILYRTVHTVLGRLVPIASMSGCPTTTGLVLHSIVFFFVVFGMMHLRI